MTHHQSLVYFPHFPPQIPKNTYLIRIIVHVIITYLFSPQIPKNAYFRIIVHIIIWTSLYESAVGILLVAIYQFVSIRMDPFGTRRVITTPRCVAICIVTWVMMVGLALAVTFGHNNNLYTIDPVIWGASLTLTSACYILIYCRVSKTPSTDNVQLQQRKAENKRVLRTFGLILGTSVACYLFIIVYWITRANNHDSACLTIAAELFCFIDVCMNPIIYWWRSKEFRSAFPFGKMGRGVLVDVLV